MLYSLGICHMNTLLEWCPIIVHKSYACWTRKSFRENLQNEWISCPGSWRNTVGSSAMVRGWVIVRHACSGGWSSIASVAASAEKIALHCSGRNVIASFVWEWTSEVHGEGDVWKIEMCDKRKCLTMPNLWQVLERDSWEVTEFVRSLSRWSVIHDLISKSKSNWPDQQSKLWNQISNWPNQKSKPVSTKYNFDYNRVPTI